MTKVAYLPGRCFTHLGRDCVILDILDLAHVLVRYLDDDRPARTWIGELLPAQDLAPAKADALQRRVRQDLTLVKDADWKAARNKLLLIRPILATEATRRTKEQVAAIAKKAGKHISTIYDWVSIYEHHGTLSSLVRLPRSDRGTTRLDAATEAIMKKEVAKYLTPERPSIADIHERISKSCARQGIRCPDVATVRRRIMTLSPEAVTKARHGAKAARDRYQPTTGSYPNYTGPLGIIQIDHSPLDIIFVDEEHRKPVGGRATLTIASSPKYKMVTGFNVAFEAPSAQVVGACLTHAVLPKERFLADLGIEGEWPCWGVMKVLHTDNAAEFLGEAIGFGCEEWGIELRQRPKGLPNHAGHIERSFRTFMSKVHRLKGTTFSNTRERLEYDSEGRAFMTLNEFKRWFTIYIVKYHHHRRHRGLGGLVPIKVWEEAILGTQDEIGAGLPERIADEVKFRLDFLPHLPRTVQEYGIEMHSHFFWDEVLRPWVHAPDPDDPKKKRKFIVKYDPFCFNEVYFLDPDLKRYFTIPSRNRAHAPVSLYQVRDARAKLRAKGASQVNEHMIFGAIDEMDAEVDAAAAKTKAARRQKERRRDWKTGSVKAMRESVAPPPPTIPPPAPEPAEDDQPLKTRRLIIEPAFPTGNGPQ